MSNPRNPYPREIGYDEHVWLPGLAGAHQSLEGIADSHEAVLAMARRLFPEIALASHVREHKLLVQSVLLDRLSDEERKRVAARCAELGVPTFALNMLRIGTHDVPGIAERLGLVAANPPAGVHRMQKGDARYIGDIYAANMVASTLDALGLAFADDGCYLDFGCSSGSLLRTLSAYRPAARFIGADPVEASIAWIRENVPAVEAFQSPQSPPVDLPDGCLDGATAISIWSHFGEAEALAWFAEMARLVRPGGWLLFTTHGVLSVYRHCYLRLLPPTRLKALFEGLLNADFVFEEKFIADGPDGLDPTGWGNAYILRSWLVRCLAEDWSVLAIEPGANQSNQDIVVLERR